MKYLTTKQINEALLKASRKPIEYMIIRILSATGVRVSELINIQVQDIQFEQKQLIVRGKGKKIRTIDLPGNLVTELKLRIKYNHLKNKDKLINLTRQRIYQITKEIAGVNPHIFRHSYAIHLLRKTKNIRYVQMQLGHENIATTQIYLRYMDFDEEKNTLDTLYM
ncbi:MAG: tyrosine-type recombinase/integrase [Candidatus Hodarchaeales archaeon]